MKTLHFEITPAKESSMSPFGLEIETDLPEPHDFLNFLAQKKEASPEWKNCEIKIITAEEWITRGYDQN